MKQVIFLEGAMRIILPPL